MLPPTGGTAQPATGAASGSASKSTRQPGKIGSAGQRGKSTSFAASLRSAGGPNGPVPALPQETINSRTDQSPLKRERDGSVGSAGSSEVSDLAEEEK